jgi:hypothetical protein
MYILRSPEVYHLPKFPSLADVWSGSIAGAWPNPPYCGYAPTNTGLPRISDTKCELVGRPFQAGGQMRNSALAQIWGSGQVCIYFPKGSDIRDETNVHTFCDTILVDGKWLCVVVAVYPIGLKFDNEFLCAVCNVVCPNGPP